MKRLIHRIPTAARTILGLLFLVFGLNGFFHFLPQPPPTPEGAAFLGGLASSGYFFPFLKGTEVVVGLLLLSGRLVPLALTVLAPITLNIVLYHTLLDPKGFGLAAVILVAHLFVAWTYRSSFKAVLNPHATADAPAARKARLESLQPSQARS